MTKLSSMRAQAVVRRAAACVVSARAAGCVLSARAAACVVSARAIACVVAVMVAACANAPSDGPTVTREERGDTTVVRVAGTGAEYDLETELRIGELDGGDEYTFGLINALAVDDAGSLYVLDAQALEVRVYSPDGAFVRRIGRAGGGPGELRQPNGLAMLPDGRLLVRDPRTGRMNVYTADGDAVTSWPIPGGFFTSTPLFVDDEGNVYTEIIAERSPQGVGRLGLLRLNREGAVVDTLRSPLGEYQRPTLQAVSPDGGMRASFSVPFWPSAYTTVDNRGRYVGGVSERYEILTWQPDGRIQRIEREVEPVPVHHGEAEAAIERTTRAMRRTQENWRWDGPRPPATKPLFRGIRVASDGRIWVRTSQPAQRWEPDGDTRDHAGLPPLPEWREPEVHDVFESDGSYFGSVRFPERFTAMHWRGDHVWGVIRDDYDVQYVVRMRLRRPTAGQATGPSPST